jgi:hypothetical protein
MPRPLIQHAVVQLAELFSKSKADTRMLKQLEYELQHRQVPRAVALLAEVQAAMHEGSVGETPVTVSPTSKIRALASAAGSQQPDLWAQPSETLVVVPPLCTVTPAAKPLEFPLATKPAISTPAMPLEDAYKVLKATPGATWESIEQMRRLLVQGSQPSQSKSLSAEKRTLVLAEARRVNAAYAALSQIRCGGR